LRSDKGGEYFFIRFDEFCENITHQRLTPYTSQQNGLVKRKNWTLGDVVNAMLLNGGLPSNL